jgi:predicted amidophosphoribosyltransferase
MYEALKQQQSLGFDCVVPIPLSPDKQERGHVNRTRILANELAALLGVRVADVLSLSAPISKRQFLSAGWTQAKFEYRYHQFLQVDAAVTKYARILLLDDVCTQGSTLNCALRRIREAHPHAQLTATTAGQMLLKSVVTDDRLIVGQKPALLFTDLSPETR